MVTRLKYLKAAFVLFCLLSGLQPAQAQYSLIAYPPPPGFSYQDFWHLTLSAAPPDTNYTEFYIALRILDNGNQLLVKTNSAHFEFTSSSLYINTASINSISPLLTDFTSSQLYADAVDNGGPFPPGSYTANFTLYGRPTDGEFSELASYSYEITADLLFPPYLITVANGDSVCETYPVFSWTPAVSSMNIPFTYIFRLVEVTSGQTDQAAMSSNPLYFTETSWPVTLLTYPASAQPLVFGHHYAWQVEAAAGSLVLGQSEVWGFIYGCHASDTLDSLPVGGVYYRLRQDADGGSVILNDHYLRIAYTERHWPGENGKLRYEILRSDGKKASYDPIDIPVKEGDNYLIVDVCANGWELESGYYVLFIKSAAGESYSLHFSLPDQLCD